NNAGIFIAKPFTQYTEADYGDLTRRFAEETQAKLEARPIPLGAAVRLMPSLVRIYPCRSRESCPEIHRVGNGSGESRLKMLLADRASRPKCSSATCLCGARAAGARHQTSACGTAERPLLKRSPSGQTDPVRRVHKVDDVAGRCGFGCRSIAGFGTGCRARL